MSRRGDSWMAVSLWELVLACPARLIRLHQREWNVSHAWPVSLEVQCRLEQLINVQGVVYGGLPFKDLGPMTTPLSSWTSCDFAATWSVSSPLIPVVPAMSSFVWATTDRFLVDATLRFRFCGDVRPIPSAVDSREWAFEDRPKRWARSGAGRI